VTAAPVLCYRPNWLDDDAATGLQAALRERAAWRQERLRLYGRDVAVPRLVAWYGDRGINYRYSGTDHLCGGWLSALEGLRTRVAAEAGLHANLVLLNRYRDGNDYMGWHSDDERGHGPLIASVSLGATRRFLVRPAGTGRAAAEAPSLRLDLEHGSLLVMDGSIPHSLPPTRRRIAERINLTFRSVGEPS
jgi:alkylated DNA repair dioxygenase AlkB